MRHELKTWPEFYRAVKARKKTFELRYNDRNYQVDDELLLKEFDPCRTCKGKGSAAKGFQTPYGVRIPDLACEDCRGTGGRYTGDSALYLVTYVLAQHPGIYTGYVILGLYDLASGDAFV